MPVITHTPQPIRLTQKMCLRAHLGNSMNGTGVSLQDQWARQNIQKIFACCRTFAIISPTDLPLSAAADTDITSC